MSGRIIGCPACGVTYDQDEHTAGDGSLDCNVPCGQPGARQCAARRRWAATEIPDDDVMDDGAIELAAQGLRVVRLTEAEAVEALRRMVTRNPDILAGEAARRLGLTVRQLAPLLQAAGMSMTPDEPVRPPRHLTLMTGVEVA